MDPRKFGFIDPPQEDGLEAAVINLKQVCRKEPQKAIINLKQVCRK